MMYFEVVKTNILLSMMYKWNLIITSLVDGFRFIAEYVFWAVIFAASTNSEMYGHTIETIITYYLLMYVIGTLTGMGNLGYKAAEDIKDGRLSNLLMKPLSCFKYYFCESAGQKLPQFICSAIAFIPIMLIFRKQITVTGNMANLLFFLLALALAIMLTYVISLLFSMLVFWLTDITGLFFMKDIIIDLLSGRIFPIDIMPAGMFAFLGLLPFSYCTYFPISILTGDKSLSGILWGFAFQVLWIVVCYILCKILWARGIMRYQGTGM